MAEFANPTVPAHTLLIASAAAGASTGLFTDAFLFPLDTIKTRVQSAQGFSASGGFSGVYRGLCAATCGSAPGSLMFFVAYEGSRRSIRHSAVGSALPAQLIDAVAATAGEICGLLARVPMETVKQRLQANIHPTTRSAIKAIWHRGPRTFYMGYGVTLLRDIPFGVIQFPLYEDLRRRWAKKLGVEHLAPAPSAICGAVSAAVAAILTTPFDVVKTRLMLGKDRHGAPYSSAIETACRIRRDEGLRAFFHGVVPRVNLICLGGFIFLGAYEATRSAVLDYIT
eukprot:TRINITY_DN80910_c0_g1_i1.p1 TRINITY_DN80910_c0_g1~~TRINITY_DN80910_c0_g1_i1.p1  ORF type:complete len:290 (+),score=12.90 TRINITY_DN80910_c0_g1_i1:24-872(+)